MSRTRLLTTLTALLAAGAVRAQEPKKESPPASADPKVEALIKEAVDKAKQELREEIRVELQGAQAAAEFQGTAAEGPKFQFLELDGYLRTRGDLFDNLDLHRDVDANGQYVHPPVIFARSGRGTQSTANMRLRLEPTINVSEHVRVRAQLDAPDNAVYGSQFADRPLLNLKRVWGEVETPVGLLSFGRMPSVWGLGIVAPAADALDDDFGLTVDRMQFATFPINTPVGQLTFIPYLTFNTEGTLSPDPVFGAGSGQPYDLDSSDDGRTFGLKVVRLDTEQETRRKFERGEASVNYGAFYEYSTLPRVNLAWQTNGFAAGTAASGADPTILPWVDRREYRHGFDLWYRYRTPRFHLEGEFAGTIGQIGNPGPFAWTVDADGTYRSLLDYSGPQVLLRQFGGALKASYQIAPNKFTLGAEVGFASGDAAPGMGNRPGQLDTTTSGSPELPTFGAHGQGGPLEGPQYNNTGDHKITNFRFDPGYRVDMILWRELLGNVTDAWYVKPTYRWDVLTGVILEGQLVYSQAMFGSSTPSASTIKNGVTPLGIELDTKLSYAADDGFRGWIQYGVLQPLDGFSGRGSLSRAHAIRLGLAIKF